MNVLADGEIASDKSLSRSLQTTRGASWRQSYIGFLIKIAFSGTLVRLSAGVFSSNGLQFSQQLQRKKAGCVALTAAVAKFTMKISQSMHPTRLSFLSSLV